MNADMTLILASSKDRPGRWQRIRYRVGQFAMSLWPRVAQDERALLTLWLPPKAANLFLSMGRRDQRHSLNVFYTLRSAGLEQPDLLAAALLHDVGKSAYEGRRLRLWHRVAIVLLAAFAPRQLARLSARGDTCRCQPQSWRYPFYLHAAHPELGARLAQEAGCSELTVALIRRHQMRLLADQPSVMLRPEGDEESLLATLQAADDAN